jgi:hypothetical protein
MSAALRLDRQRCAALVHSWYAEAVAMKSKTARAGSFRKSVTMPAALAARQQLKAACRDFVREAEPERKNEAGVS